jgi:hypothetical protein
MSSQTDKAMDFWYSYDDFFLFHSPDNIKLAIRQVDPYGRLVELFYHHRRRGTLNSEFITELQNVKDSINLLADNSRRIFEEFFEDDVNLEQTSFELFAQGLLYDDRLDSNGLPRRPAGDKIHMMDSGITGYVVWHAFARAVELLGLTDRMPQTDRHIALAAGILAALIKSGRPPVQSNDPSNNKPLDPASLDELRSSWLNFQPEEIDDRIVELEGNSISRHIL